MKKGTKLPYLISASLLLVLASCDGGNQPSFTSESSVDLGTSEPETSAIASDASVQGSTLVEPTTPPESSDRGTFNTTVLGNAFTESLTKDQWQMVFDNPKIQAGLASYTVLGTAPNYSLMKASTNNILIQAEDATMTKSTASASQGGSGGLGSLLGGGSPQFHYNINNITVVAGAISTILPNATNITNQDLNVYYDDNTIYWDFLDENGAECTGLSNLMDLAFSAAMNISDSGSDIEFQHKGKIELGSTYGMIISLMFSESMMESIWSSGFDPVLQSLWTAGADMETKATSPAGTPAAMREYKTTIKINDPSILTGTVSDTLEDSDGTTGALIGSSSPLGDVTEQLDGAEDMFSTFECEMSFVYSATELKSMSTSVKATTDEAKVKESLLEDDELEAGDSKFGLENIEMTQNITFNYQNIDLGFPASFDDYVTQELPVEEEEEPVEEPISSESSEVPASI